MIYHMKAVPICGTVFEEGWMSCCSVVISGWISRRDLCFAALDPYAMFLPYAVLINWLINQSIHIF